MTSLQEQVPVPWGRVAQRTGLDAALQTHKRLALISLRRPMATLKCGDLRERWSQPTA